MHALNHGLAHEPKVIDRLRETNCRKWGIPLSYEYEMQRVITYAHDLFAYALSH